MTTFYQTQQTSLRATDKRRELGSVFFYILLAIVLFGALTYAASRGSRTGASSLTDEQAKLAAQEIIDYGNTIANAVQKLRLRGCSDTEISFENSIGPVNYTNSNAPADKSCHIFDLAGGKTEYKFTPTAFLVSSPSFTGLRFSSGFQHENVGSIENELTLKINWLKRDICLKINSLLGITNPSDEPPIENNDSAALQFTGTYGTTVTDTVGDDGTGLDGKITFCRYQSSDNLYQFNQVLIAR